MIGLLCIIGLVIAVILLFTIGNLFFSDLALGVILMLLLIVATVAVNFSIPLDHRSVSSNEIRIYENTR